MNVSICKSCQKIAPGELGLRELSEDWHGERLEPPVRWAFGMDPEYFHFRAARAKAARCHPEARPGGFQPELWQHDVAEFFLLDPGTGRYLEFNLAPNGAWWSAEFTAPRQMAPRGEAPIPGVRTRGMMEPEAWEVEASLPRRWLEERYRLGPASRLNATFILDSPRQRFCTVGAPGDGEPDFHRPEAFPKVALIPFSEIR